MRFPFARAIKMYFRAFRRAVNAQTLVPVRPLKRVGTPRDGVPKYEELVEVLALHIHDHWLSYDGFDHHFSSSQQIAATVLEKVRILRRPKKYSTPLEFDCWPEDFRKRAADNKEVGCTYDAVVIALIGMLNYGKGEDEFLECLMRLGVFELDDDGRYVQTAKYDDYEKLRGNWPSLIA